MFPQAFDYARAATVDEAIALATGADDPQFMAGGHSLLPMMKLRMAAPELVIDIRGITELRGVTVGEDIVRIGALTRHVDLIRDAALNAALPIFAMAGEQIADRQVRNRGTIGGSVVNADPSADWPGVLMMLGAECEISGPDGKRGVPLREFIEGMMTVDLGQGELLTALTFPVPPAGSGYHYEKFRHPASGYAVAGAAVRILKDDTGRIAEAAIGITGCAEAAFRAEAAEGVLVGKTPGQDVAEAAAIAAFDGVELLSDGYADAAYRLQLGKTLVARAILGAAG